MPDTEGCFPSLLPASPRSSLHLPVLEHSPPFPARLNHSAAVRIILPTSLPEQRLIRCPHRPCGGIPIRCRGAANHHRVAGDGGGGRRFSSDQDCRAKFPVMYGRTKGCCRQGDRRWWAGRGGACLRERGHGREESGIGIRVSLSIRICSSVRAALWMTKTWKHVYVRI